MGTEWVEEGYREGIEWVQTRFIEGTERGIERIQIGYRETTDYILEGYRAKRAKEKPKETVSFCSLSVYSVIDGATNKVS